MSTKLDRIRAKLAALETKNTQNSGNADNTIYPFWNIKPNESVTLRFLPDGREDADFFWVERQMIRLPFSGIKGGDNTPTTVQVPCVEMFDSNARCPIHTELRAWFKTKKPELDELARKYWKKRSYIFQGFVIENALAEDNPPENPIRRFILNRQLFNTVENHVLHDPDVDEIPTDYQKGTNFRITKTMKGEYADYSTSKFVRKETALSNDHEEAIDQFGLFDLSKSLPVRPNDEALEAIMEMFEVSIDGGEYDPQKWESFYRPFGFTMPSAGPTSSETEAPEPQPAAASPKSEEPVDDSESSVTADGGVPAKDILDMIRNRETS